MTFQDYYKAMTAKSKLQFAKKVKTSVPYLSQIAHGHRTAGPMLAVRISRATGNKVTKKNIRPDLWGK